MAEPLASPFELGLRPPAWLTRVMTRARVISQRSAGIQHFEHMLRVRLPIGSKMKLTPGLSRSDSRLTNSG